MEFKKVWDVEDKRILFALRMAKIGFWQYDTRTHSVSWSPEIYNMFGLCDDGRPIDVSNTLYPFIHPDDLDATKAMLARFAAGELHDHIYRICLDAGEIRYLHSTAVGFSGPSDSIVYGLVRDITEQKLLELELLESKERYESLKKYNSDGICSLDSSGLIIRTNPAFGRMTGYPLDELVGTPYNELIATRHNSECPHQSMDDGHICLRHADGRCVQVQQTEVPIVVRNQTVGAYIVLQDVTERKRQELELRRSKELFQLISTYASDVIFLSDLSGVCTYISPSVTSLLGYAPEDLTGKSLVDFCHPGQIFEITHAFERVAKGLSVDPLVCLLRDSRGQYRWFETNIQSHATDTGNVLVGIARDVTSRKQAEDELVSLKKLYQSILTAAAEGIVGLDASGRVTFANPVALNTFLYVDSEMIGKRFMDLIETSDQPAGSQLAWLEEVLRNGRPIRVQRSSFVRSNGEAFPCEYNIAPILENGAVAGAVVTFADISDRVQVEQEIRRHRQNLRYAQQLAKLGYWEYDIDEQRLIWADDMFELWGIPRETFEGTLEAFFETLVPEDRSRTEQQVLAALSGTPLDTEYGIVRPDGSIRYMHATGETIVDEQSGKRRFFGTVQDVTSRRTSEIALKESQDLLQRSEKLSAVGQLAAGVAHEIRNPLTAIKGFIDLMRQSRLPEEQSYFDIMKNEVARMELIVGELLMLAKPQSVEYVRESVESIIQEVVSFMNSHAIIHNVEIDLEIGRGIQPIRCEPNQLKQVFINVIRNGIEAMASGGILRITVERGQGFVHVLCSDEGTGIGPDELARLGEPFFTTKRNGTGLGLMVTKRIIEEHGGNIEFDSVLGKGTTVRIGLPESG